MATIQQLLQASAAVGAKNAAADGKQILAAVKDGARAVAQVRRALEGDAHKVLAIQLMAGVGLDSVSDAELRADIEAELRARADAAADREAAAAADRPE